MPPNIRAPHAGMRGEGLRRRAAQDYSSGELSLTRRLRGGFMGQFGAQRNGLTTTLNLFRSTQLLSGTVGGRLWREGGGTDWHCWHFFTQEECPPEIYVSHEITRRLSLPPSWNLMALTCGRRTARTKFKMSDDGDSRMFSDRVGQKADAAVMGKAKG